MILKPLFIFVRAHIFHKENKEMKRWLVVSEIARKGSGTFFKMLFTSKLDLVVKKKEKEATFSFFV